MEGIVTGIKLAQNQAENVYSVLGKEMSIAKSPLALSLLDLVDVDSKGNAKMTGKSTSHEYGKAVKGFIKSHKLGKLHALKKTGVKELDSVSKKMLPKLGDAASVLIRNIVTGAPVVVRFHNDCDGSTGAIALYDAVEKLCRSLGIDSLGFSWKMNRGVSYSTDGFYSDTAFFNSFSSIEKPIVLITDFGTTFESDDAVGLCKGNRVLLWLDHHPPYTGFPGLKLEHYINPWSFGSDSDYTAGFLASVFAEHLAGIDAEMLKEASLIGDYSKYANRSNEKAHKIAIVLDYLTSKKEANGRTTPKQMKPIVEDSSKLNEAFAQASALLSEAIEMGVKKANKYITKDNIRVYSVEFSEVASGNDDYPLPGRYSSWLQNRFEGIEESGRVITLVTHGSYISVRATRSVVRERDLLKMMEQLKKSTEHIVSFGGHGPAFSVRAESGRTEHVVKLILHELGASR